LLNGLGARFVNELAPRDIVCAAILREIAEGRAVERDGTDGVLLDTPALERAEPGILGTRLMTLSHLAKRSGFNPITEPFLVRPTLHYQNGGIAIDPAGHPDVAGLFCVGEASGGLHGRNRMMGNALLELVAFGRRAGAAAATSAHVEAQGAVGVGHLAAWERGLVEARLPAGKRAPLVFPPYGNVDLLALLRRENAS
jgi:succinate dehydrogenase / fumarate reductase flavoprotein subunit/L-aspartate oxidase